jgi:hypothetical protein
MEWLRLHSVAAYERVCNRGAKPTVLNVLLDLPEELSRPVVLEWLCLKHTVRLDLSICNRKLRRQHFSLLHGQLVKFPVNSYRQHSNYEATLTWITARSVQPDGICVSRSCKSSEQLLEKLTVNSGAASFPRSKRICMSDLQKPPNSEHQLKFVIPAQILQHKRAALAN